MSRAIWFVAGAGAGVYGVVRARRAAEAFTAEGLQDRIGALFLGARMFRDEVARGATEREIELRDRFAVRPHGRPELTAGRVPTLRRAQDTAGSTGADADQQERDGR